MQKFINGFTVKKAPRFTAKDMKGFADKAARKHKANEERFCKKLLGKGV